MALQVGQRAPQFSIFNTEKSKIALSDFIGKNVLILFFPQAFTSVCTNELCAIRDDISRYNNLNNEVIGISVDSVFTLNKFKTDQNYNFTLLSDFNKEVSSVYGALYADWILEMKGVSKRAAFIVDKIGMLQYVEVLESAGDVPNFDAINSKLEQLNA